MYNILSIAQRTIVQLARDRRTLALILIVPLVIASLFGVSIPDKAVLNLTLPAMLATLILFFGFLLSGIAFLRERSQGTRERLMASPVSRIDILAGYLLGFLLFAMVQTLILFFYSVYVLKVDFHGDLWQIIIFQLIIVPQVFVCGLIFPVSQMPDYLQWIAKFLPLTYGVDGIRALMLQGKSLLDIGKEISVLVAYAIGLLILAGISLRRGSST